METDRDQLALAAKAAGKTRAEWDWVWLAERGENVARDMLWDPRRDSGQAFELAIMLDMHFQAHFGGGWDFALAGVKNPDYDCDLDPEPSKWLAEQAGDDSFAASRMAIFRAAVAIGKAHAMTVAELIEVLQCLPGHHPVQDACGDVVVGAGPGSTYGNSQSGPVVVLYTRGPK